MTREKFKVSIDRDLEDIIPSFMDNRQKDLVELKKAIETQDMPTMKVIGHKLAGNAGSYGFDELGDYGAALETAATKSEFDNCKKAIDQIVDYVNNVEVVYK